MTAYIALGSNLGDRWANISAALRRLRAEPGLRVIASSNFYDTAPVNCPPGSSNFLNAVVAIETERLPEDLLQLCRQIEQQFGRVRCEPNAPRTLDLDILLHGERVINTPELIVPHPRLHERAFVLVPLAELATRLGVDAVHPILKKTARQLLAQLQTNPGEPLPRTHSDTRIYPQTLAGLRALVTGSTRGIGLAIAKAFVDHGADVAFHGHSQPAANAAMAKYFVADLRDPLQVDRLATEVWGRFGGLDILVSNAGADTLTGEAAKWSFDEKLESLLAVDLKATMRLSRCLGTRMKERGCGCVITIGWDQAETGMGGESGELFAAVKGAVMCFTRSLALSLAPTVRVNCIAPGWIRTAWGETASAVWQERVRRETPRGVWGLPEDVASVALWLASPEAGFITGQTICVNGGAVR
jgi:2-amino-4-hydroxy-6-hydroxymethyldihydropteridine diphosphokinase